MAGADSRRQLLTLIRDFADEKSLGERRVSELKRRQLELRPVLDAANEKVEAAKRLKEITEQELKGSEVELSLSEASIQAQESRISLLQEEISRIGAELVHLKNEGQLARDDFVNKMYEINKAIRNFQEKTLDFFHAGNRETRVNNMLGFSSTVDALRHGENELALLTDQVQTMEEDCHKEQNANKEVLQELGALQSQVSVMEAILKETKELQELARQTAASEQLYESLAEELRRQYKCPRGHVNNTGD